VGTLVASGLTGTFPAAAAGGGAPGITSGTVKIGIISDLTGDASSTFADSPAAMEARFKQINASGGVDGRKIIWSVADTQSSSTTAETAAKALVQSQSVFAISEVSALMFGAAPYLQKAGVPVLGSQLDGPEWYEQPNTNMFNIEGPNSPSEPAYTDYANLYKSLGVKKVSEIASNTPSSTRTQTSFEEADKSVGLSTCDDTVVPLGDVNFTTYALSFKSAGCDLANCSCVLSSSLAVSTALKQEGLSDTKVVFDAGPSNQVTSTPADITASTGAYFPSLISFTDAAGKTMLAGLKKYDPSYKGGTPDLGAIDGWQVANLTLEGLQVAGQNPTRTSFITKLRNVSNWNDNGLAAPVSFVHFGQAPPKMCYYFYEFVNKKYVPTPRNGKPTCGKELPGTGTSTS
jgi:branched-chain amino acid transport system substrate-binding protein